MAASFKTRFPTLFKPGSMTMYFSICVRLTESYLKTGHLQGFLDNGPKEDHMAKEYFVEGDRITFFAAMA